MFKARRMVGLHTYSAGGPDPHRSPPVYSPARDMPGAQHAAYGWHIPETREPVQDNHPQRVLVAVELLVPPEFPAVSAHDLIDLPAAPAGQFEVIGYGQDYDRGPGRFRPGAVINLRRVDG